jgi:urease accessory protein
MDHPSHALDADHAEAPATQRDPSEADPPESDVTQNGGPSPFSSMRAQPAHRGRAEPAGPRDFAARAFTVGVGGPVGSGKTALVAALCKALRDTERLGVVTNDAHTREDADFLRGQGALAEEAILAVETGDRRCAAIADEIGPNLDALDTLMRTVAPALLFVESAGDDLGAEWSPALADYTICVIDAAAGDRIPRKGGPAILRSDLVVINKTDLAPLVGASLDGMDRDLRAIREGAPYVFAQCTRGVGVDAIASHVLAARRAALGAVT